ncbi:hypothetical protein JYU34_005151 [Plutella xylostella]|uniref:Uncharacterized protein n=1 Tax=Plutella xylostella TaxID=51655 RepID=A0ABQ7QW43_PLUXY|nr:hypothetical protein JYU34_005151 [Plutella xylostella]
MGYKYGSKNVELLLVFCCLFILPCHAHINMDVRMLSELKGICEVAYSCYHDQVLICGQSVSQARTFLDLCDMYEYACEYSLVFRHVKDDDSCPNERDLDINVG